MDCYNSNSAEIKRTALVVEDDFDIKLFYSFLLLKKGFSIMFFDSGTDARDYIQRGFHYDVAFFDHSLADGVTGLDLAKLSKKVHPHVKTICASGGIESLAETGAFDITIRKPFAERGILWALDQVFGN